MKEIAIGESVIWVRSKYFPYKHKERHKTGSSPDILLLKYLSGYFHGFGRQPYRRRILYIEQDLGYGEFGSHCALHIRNVISQLSNDDVIMCIAMYGLDA
jgi:hypothetical protein